MNQELVSAEEAARSKSLFSGARAKIKAGEWDRDAWIQFLRDVQRDCPWSMEAAAALGMNPGHLFASSRDEFAKVMAEINAPS